MHPVFTIRMCSLQSIFILSIISMGDLGTRTVNAQVESSTARSEQVRFSAEQIEFFESKVRPLLVDNCFECHGTDPDSLEGGLSLASRRSILTGGDSGPAIDLETPDESLMLSAVEYGDLFQMPPDGQLSDEKIEIIRTWITDGAAWPESAEEHVVATEIFDLEARRESHWCWQPVARPAVPDVGDDWALDPLDRFVLAKLQENNLAAAGPATKETWIRRATFDLTGLPPSLEEIDSFLEDESTDAHEKVVDRLLASPHFGERWARHWMDLIRYAETCGHEFDYPIPNAWQYRDYLIRAFYKDVPYNDFVVEHIAGDLVTNPRRNPENQINESVLGTGFWFLGEATHGPVDVKGDEAGHIDNQIDVMGKTFLGLTVACARCHDHKFDAISTKDYYALAGFLQSSRRQDVMLDPDRKIETAWKKARAVSDGVSAEIEQLIEQLESKAETAESRVNQFAHEIKAAILFLQADHSWVIPADVMIEGETLKTSGTVTGNVRPQEISGWSNSSQLWWTDGAVGDSIRLEFEVPTAGQYELIGQFTKAPDYGIIQFSVDDQTTGDPFDFYAETVSRSEEMALGTMELTAGKHSLQLTIIGKNDKAAPGYMAGIDYLLLRGHSPNIAEITAGQRLEELALKHKLEPERLRNWVAAIADSATARPMHPFNEMRLAAESTIDLTSESGKSYFLQRIGELTKTKNSMQKPTKPLVPAPPLSQWKSTGFAFDNPLPVGIDGADADHAVITSPWDGSIPNSGRNGTRFQGVLRSPTFEIGHSHIHYLVKARKSRVRLIIDGFTLDVYNPLLFEGMSIPLDTDGQWEWVTQSGDIRNYIGHRAYIEIIDDGEGYVAVNAVKFSDTSEPHNSINEVTGLFASIQENDDYRDAGDFGPLTVFAWNQAVAIDGCGILGASTSGPNVRNDECLNWLLHHHLIPGIDYLKLESSLTELRLKLDSINQEVPAPILAIGMTDGTPENEYVFIRGNHKNLGEEAHRRPLTALEHTDRWSTLELNGSGRMELARDLISPDNPLVARVMVNRIWHHLTGRGIVAAVDNFGVLGDEPTHPELLDYLASEFVDQGWSIKNLIRRIVLSQTYRMSSVVSEHANETDPNNDLLHAFRVRRLQGEAIRDAMLAVSGELDPTLYGESVPIHLTPFMQGRGRPDTSGPLDGNGRRSIYTEIRRNFLSPMMLAFDAPIPFNSMGRRNQSNVPAQSLIMLNDPFVIDQAEKWASRLIESVPDRQVRLQTAFRAATGRLPSESELGDLNAFVDSQADLLGVSTDEIDSSKAVWTDTLHVIFNLKEFIYLN